MRVWLAAFAAFVLAAMPGVLPLQPALAEPAAKDWSAKVTQLPSGAYLMGNPKAKVRLVEYLSLTCPHCAHFTLDAIEPLKAGYVKPGLVSLEVRHAIRDPFDLAAALLARCKGPGGYFPASTAVFAAQPAWLERATAFEKEQSAQEAKSVSEQLIVMSRGAGLSEMFEKSGLTQQRVNACLSNGAEQKRLAAMRDEAWNTRKIGGTPSFLINDVLQEGVYDWETLEPKLKDALK